jgi:hypothetical protein
MKRFMADIPLPVDFVKTGPVILIQRLEVCKQTVIQRFCVPIGPEEASLFQHPVYLLEISVNP